MLKKEDKNYDLSISIYADRSHNNVQLKYRLYMPVKHIKTLRQSIQGLKPRWTNYYNDGGCNTNDFFQHLLTAKEKNAQLNSYLK